MYGLYIHIPFCYKKCSYCDFVSFGGRQDLLPPYLHALKEEAKQFKGAEIDTVFIGGGTPSLMETEQIADLCTFLHQNFNIKGDAEFTMEANPQSLTLDKIIAAKDGGVNRFSVGAQSLSDSVLKDLGRSHTLKQFETAIENIKKADIKNFNLDLIFALPNQTLEMWLKTLNKAVNYGSTHISCYSLIVDENTPLGASYNRGEISLPDEETERLMYKAIKETLEKNGIYQYEVSNYAKKGYECKHNIKYWQAEEYIGLGCAAHSYYNGARYNNTLNLNDYINQKDIVTNKEILTKTDMQEEFIFLGLRMNRGIDLSEYKKRFNCDFISEHNKQIQKLKKLNLIDFNERYLFLTEKGMDILDSVVLEFIKEI